MVRDRQQPTKKKKFEFLIRYSALSDVRDCDKICVRQHEQWLK